MCQLSASPAAALRGVPAAARPPLALASRVTSFAALIKAITNNPQSAPGSLY